MEHKSGQRRVLRKVLLICALGVGVLLLPVAAWRIGRYYFVERAVQAFRSNPSQTGADKLIDLLDKRSPTQAQAARILRLLLQPKVVIRSAYPVGRKSTISTLLPFYLHFNTTMSCRVDVLADGQDFLMPQSSRFTYLGTGPHVWTLPVAPDSYGKFNMELGFFYSLAAPPSWLYPRNPIAQFLYDLLDRIGPQRRSTGSEERPYQVGFNVSADINVVPQAEAEQVQLLSSPELDARMKEALRVNTSGWPVPVYARRLPANVAFNCFLELPDGTRRRVSSLYDQHLTGYGGRGFEVDVWPLDWPVKPSGTREAKLVFEPDPNRAFEEPTIKSIWNGRLEFPVRIPYAPEPNAGE